MSKFMIRMHNTETDEIIDREMTSDEIVNYKLVIAEGQARRAEENFKAQAKTDLFTRLGITADEAKLLLS